MMIDARPPIGRTSPHGAPIGPATAAAPVLVIDDEASGSTATMALLAASGYPTTAESDGDAVLRLVRTEVMRLVVSELYIPCAEGRCIIAALKRDRTRLPRLRVLAYSRHATTADDEWALAAGSDAVLHKPAPDNLLLREVDRLDGRSEVRPE
jgi:CheY-like chemotaxis protein